MVSLGSTRSSNRGQFGFSLDPPTINSQDSDEELIVDHVQIVAGPEMRHIPMRTTWIIWFAKVLYILLGVSAYLVPLMCTDGKCGEDPISLTLYIHGAMWFILLILDRFLQKKHEQGMRSGYLDFYRKTRNIRRLPFMINSCANALMVVMIKVLDSHCLDSGKCWVLTKTRYIQILVSLECVVALIVLLVYLVWTVKFNSSRALPDVHKEELLTSFVNSNAEIGFRDSHDIDDVMEKQADMIRYLRQHSEYLSRRNLFLTQQLSRAKAARTHSINGNF